MKKNSFTFLSTFVLLALALTSCAPDSAFNIDPSTGDDSFCLSSKRGAFTRAGEGSTFVEGTKYQLYAITSANGFMKNYLQADAAFGAVTGTETAGHIGGIAAHTFGGKELDFYAMTDGTANAITLQVNELTKEPAYTFTYNTDNNGYLSTEPTDALWAKKENQTCKNAGVIDLPFKHVMAKLNLFVVKQMDVNSTIYLDEIYIKDYPSGSFNLQTGKFDFGSQTRNKKSIRMWNYTSPSYMQEVTTTMMPVVSGEKSSLLVFPTKESNASTDKDALTIGVKYFK
ncbi:MAG: fimbrillin family protein, partial [Tannerellaceae bacterium]